MVPSPDRRRHAPATQRNRDPILAVLQRVLPPTGTVLEISSGSGEHGVYFAPRLAPRVWLPSDRDPEALASITDWRLAIPSDTLQPPLQLDASEAIWPVESGNLAAQGLPPITAIVNINMVHIAPWAACLGLMAGAGRVLPPGGVLYLYGPFKQQGEHTAPSNANFDVSLQAQNPQWGVRDLEAVVAVAQDQGLTLQETVAMPANNLSVVFTQTRQ